MAFRGDVLEMTRHVEDEAQDVLEDLGDPEGRNDGEDLEDRRGELEGGLTPDDPACGFEVHLNDSMEHVPEQEGPLVADNPCYPGHKDCRAADRDVPGADLEEARQVAFAWVDLLDEVQVHQAAHWNVQDRNWGRGLVVEDHFHGLLVEDLDRVSEVQVKVGLDFVKGEAPWGLGLAAGALDYFEERG